MAFTITQRASNSSTTSAVQTLQSSSFTPTANSRLFVFAFVEAAGHNTAPSWGISNTGSLSFSNLAQSATYEWGGGGAYDCSAKGWYADVGGSPSAMTVTVDAYSTTDNGYYSLLVFDVTGFDSGTPLAQAAVTNGANHDGVSSTSGTLTLGSAPTSGNLVVALFGVGADGGGGVATPGGYSILTNQDHGYTQCSAFYHVTTTTAAITSSDVGDSVGAWAGIAFEMTLAAGGATYTLTAAAGSLSFSGTAAAFKVSRKVTAAAGSLSMSGTAATLKVSRKITADAGSVTFTGTDAAFKVSRVLSAAAGSLSFSGTAAAFKVSRKIAAAAGSLTFSGTDANPVIARKIVAAAGSLSFAGTDATLTYTPVGGPTYTLTALAGSLSLSGTAAGLVVARKLTAGAGTFSFTGTDAGLIVGRKLSAGAGSFSLTGADIIFLVSRVLIAGSGSLTFTGTAANLEYSAALEIGYPEKVAYVVFRDKRVIIEFRDKRNFVPFRDKREIV